MIWKLLTCIIFSMYIQLIWSNSRLLKGVTILALMDMGYWFELIEMFLSWIWLTTVQPFSDVLIWTRIFIPVFSFIFLSNPMKLKTKQGCCLIRGRSKTTLTTGTKITKTWFSMTRIIWIFSAQGLGFGSFFLIPLIFEIHTILAPS